MGFIAAAFVIPPIRYFAKKVVPEPGQGMPCNPIYAATPSLLQFSNVALNTVLINMLQLISQDATYGAMWPLH